MDYGLNLRQYRKQKRMTQDQLAEASNLSTSYISQIECGKKKIGREGIEKVAFALGIPVGMLLLELENDHTKDSIVRKINVLISDCTIQELKIIYDMDVKLKDSLRANK